MMEKIKIFLLKNWFKFRFFKNRFSLPFQTFIKNNEAKKKKKFIYCENPTFFRSRLSSM